MSGSTESRNRTLFVATTAIFFFEASESTLSLYSFSFGFPILCISKKKLSPNIFLKKSALDSDSSIFPAKREFPIWPSKPPDKAIKPSENSSSHLKNTIGSPFTCPST